MVMATISHSNTQYRTVCSLLLLCLLFTASMELTEGKVFQVGDSVGWTLGGKKNYYARWASGKDFHVKDTIIFKYNSMKHNVLQVSGRDYNTCTTSSFLGKYTSGKDVLSFKGPGTYYFICGFPTHCSQGLKVAIRVSY